MSIAISGMATTMASRLTSATDNGHLHKRKSK